MKGKLKPSPAMVVAVAALIVAIGGTAVALPGKFRVGQNDLRKSSVGARALGRMVLDRTQVLKARDPVSGDGVFTEARGVIRCPPKAPTAIDPTISGMGPMAFEIRRNALPNRWGGPVGYEFIVSTDQGSEVGYAMKVNCLLTR